MISKPSFPSAVAVVALASVFSLSPARSFAASEMEEIRETQKKILERLDSQDKLLRDILQRVQAGPAGRPEADPNRVYTIPIGGSPIKGPKEAVITLVEFSDFQ